MIPAEMPQGIGPNTNAPREILAGDCVLLAGEDAATSEAMLSRIFGIARAHHAFRSYVFDRRDAVTTIISGMGTGCIEPLLWELSRAGGIRRLLLAGTAGAMPGCRIAPGRACVVGGARASAAGLEAIGLTGTFHPRWDLDAAIETASVVSTDFYYGFGAKVIDESHPLHTSRLPGLFAGAREDLVDMEAACFYALAERFMPAEVRYVAVKAPANPAGDGSEHLANTPAAIESCLQLAAMLLGDSRRPGGGSTARGR